MEFRTVFLQVCVEILLWNRCDQSKQVLHFLANDSRFFSLHRSAHASPTFSPLTPWNYPRVFQHAHWTPLPSITFRRLASHGLPHNERFMTPWKLSICPANHPCNLCSSLSTVFYLFLQSFSSLSLVCFLPHRDFKMISLASANFFLLLFALLSVAAGVLYSFVAILDDNIKKIIHLANLATIKLHHPIFCVEKDLVSHCLVENNTVDYFPWSDLQN